VSYQSLNSSSATFEKSIAAIRTPFAIAVPSECSKEQDAMPRAPDRPTLRPQRG
jgi:hypothetical protein